MASEHEKRENPPATNGGVKEVKVPELKVITTKQYSWFHSLIAINILLGAWHLIGIVVPSAFIFLPFPKALMVCAMLWSVLLFPLDEKAEYGRRLARYICKHCCGYGPITLHYEDYEAFDKNRAYIFGYEPHSVFPLGTLALTENAGHLPLSKIKVLGSSALFFVPFVKHIWTWIGVAAVSRKNFVNLLNSGYSCILVPGGTREAFHLERGSEVIFLKNRKGFVRIALETGCPLVPVFAFGQSKVYRWWKPSGKLMLEFSRIMKFTPILFGGVLGSPIPLQVPIHVVIGKPIEVKKNPQPTMEEVSEVHSQFVEALHDLFERHKARVGYPNLKLKIL